MKSFVTPRGKLLFSHLDAPNKKFDPANEKLEITISLHPDEAPAFREKLDEIVTSSLEEYAAQERDARKRSKILNAKYVPGQPEADWETGEDTGWWKFKFTTRRTPILVDGQRNEMPVSRVQIGNGSIGRLVVGVGRPYHLGQRSGVSFYLNVVQIFELKQGTGSDKSLLDDGITSEFVIEDDVLGADY